MDVSLDGHYECQRILKLIEPSILVTIVISSYSFIDGIFVSNFVGTVAYVASNLMFLILVILGTLEIMRCVNIKILDEGNR